MELNVRGVLFEAYVTAMKRGRWLLMTTTLLSALLAANVFLEQWGYQRNQLEGIEANRAFFSTPEATDVDSLIDGLSYEYHGLDHFMTRRDTLSDSIAELSKMLHCRALYSTLDTTKIKSQLDSASAEYHRLEIYVSKQDTLRDSIEVLSKL